MTDARSAAAAPGRGGQPTSITITASDDSTRPGRSAWWLRDLDHAIERARAHGLRVDRLGYGVAISCPQCRQGQDIILVEIAGFVVAKAGGCLRCDLSSVDLNEWLVGDPRSVPASELLRRIRRDVDLLAERLQSNGGAG